jgi:hypothetical protein
MGGRQEFHDKNKAQKLSFVKIKRKIFLLPRKKLAQLR